jgi:hypothetical protein
LRTGQGPRKADLLEPPALCRLGERFGVFSVDTYSSMVMVFIDPSSIAAWNDPLWKRRLREIITPGVRL